MSDSVISMEEAPKVKKERPDSLKKTPRASIFYEHHDVPHVWTRDSQSSYGGARSPSFTDNFETGSHISIDPQGNYGGFEPTENGKNSAKIGYAYEMPERYLGKGMPYSSEIAIPLTDNTWAPPVSRKKRCCGLGKTAFIVLCVLICVLVVAGVIGAIAAGVVLSKQSISKTSSTGLANPTTQTETSASTSTMTLSNGSVVLTTLIITSTNSAESQSTTQTQSYSQSQTQSQLSTATQTSAQSSTASTSLKTSSLSSSSNLVTPPSSTSIITTPTASTTSPATSPTNGTLSA